MADTAPMVGVVTPTRVVVVPLMVRVRKRDMVPVWVQSIWNWYWLVELARRKLTYWTTSALATFVGSTLMRIPPVMSKSHAPAPAIVVDVVKLAVGIVT